MNRLAGEPSAYLRQHAENPVDWQPYSEAAFAEAASRDVPVFLSVGYAACHWCHVMAHESFEDADIGAYLNEHFVSIKVDREERPDVDSTYMAATQVLSGQGGWPMSVFLTPTGQAFYAGTYFPPRPASGRPSFRQVLGAVLEAWTERREAVLEQAAGLTRALSRPAWPVRLDAVQVPPGAGSEAGAETAAILRSAVKALAEAEDTVHGGFGTAPKFPPSPVLEFLVRHAAGSAGRVPADPAAVRSAATAQALAGRTLAAMANSALFDQVGGGFARYSVTADWSEPHYEKMLYDNAALVRVLAHWLRLPEHAAFPAADARRTLAATVDWLVRELRLPGGGFASSLDADTVIDGVHHEGASYQWTRAEFAAAAAERGRPELAPALSDLMGLPADGSAGPLDPGRALSGADRERWELLLPALLQRRRVRRMPARDEKVVAAWNGLLLGALSDAAAITANENWLRVAVELGSHLRDVHWRAGRGLSRVSHDGAVRGIDGLLEDYAACADGFLALYAATGDGQWFDLAQALVSAAEERFVLRGMLVSSTGTEAALQNANGGPRPADPFDDATTGAVPLFAGALLGYAAYTGSRRHRAVAESILTTLPEVARRAPGSAGGMLGVAETLLAGPLEVAVVGPPGPVRQDLTARAVASPSPGLALAVWDGLGRAPVPLLEGRGRQPTDAGALAYVCKDMACARPVGNPDELHALLD